MGRKEGGEEGYTNGIEQLGKLFSSGSEYIQILQVPMIE